MEQHQASSEVEMVINAWDRLAQEDREALLPKLLHSIDGWRAFSFRSSSQLRWLRETFEKARVKFSYPVNERVPIR